MPATKLRFKTITATTTLVLAWSLAACAPLETAGQTSPSTEPAVEATAQATADTDTAAETPTAEQPQVDGAVSDIPLPDNHAVIDEQSAAGLDTMVVHTPGEYPEHAEWYRSALPDAGWEIVSEEPAPSTFGTVFEVTQGNSRGWVHLETFDGGTALSISVGALDAQSPLDSEEGTAAEVELPEGLPADVFLPVFSPSIMMAGGDHGDGMWVMEYVAANTDIPTVTAAIEQDIAAKGWAVMDRTPEGDGHTYVLEKPGYELILSIIPERSTDNDTSLHYTLRSH